MGLSNFTVDIAPNAAPAVRIDGLALPAGSVQGIQIEQPAPNELPQLVLYMASGDITVNGDAVTSTEPTDPPSLEGFLNQVDVMALSELAASLQGQADPRHPGGYLDNPTEAFLVALGMMAE